MVRNFVPQRPGAKDCTIAALATTIDRSYEDVATALGIEIDPATGLPDPEKLGVEMLATIYPLANLGWAGAPLVTEKAFKDQGVDRPGPDSDSLKAILPNQKAVIGYKDADPLVGDHSLAWDGKTAIDCSSGEVVPLDELEIETALLLVPLQRS